MAGSSCNAVAVTGDKTRIISGHYDGSVRIYSLKNGELIHSFNNLHESSVTSISFDLDGN